MKFSKKLVSLLVLLTGCLIFASVSSAVVADRTLSVGTGSGAAGATVNLPITIDNNTDVAGASFTLAYDPTVFSFQGLETVTQTIDDGSGASPDYSTTMFYQVNDQNNAAGDAKIGRVMVAAASAQAFSSTTLFNATFTIIGGSGTYPIILNRTAVHNPQAGYATPTLLPVLVGLPAATPNAAGFYPTSTYTTDLNDGSITVNAPGYTISGSVTYTGGTQANGSTVSLARQQGATGPYLFDGSTTVSNGTYSFSNKPAGTYRLTVMPYDASFFMDTATGIAVSANTTQDFVLATATAKTGTVTVNGSALEGVRVRVTDSSQNILGVFTVNDQGYFETLPLPLGSYTLTALYGNVELGKVTDGQTINFTQTLHSISGELDPNSNDNVPVTVHVVSPTTLMLKTVTMDASKATGDVYTVDNLLPGNYTVSAVTEGSPVLYAVSTTGQSTDIKDATEVDITNASVHPDTGNGVNFDFSLLFQATISGTVVDGAQVVGDIGVFAFNIDTYAVASDFSSLTDGAFNMTVPPGSYRLFAISNGKVFFYSTAGTTRLVGDATVITLANGESGGGDIDIAEDACNLSGNITYGQAGGAPLAGAIVVAGNGSGQAATVSQQDGSYAITGLSLGTYRVGMNPMLASYALQFSSITIDGTNCSDASLDFIIDTGNTVSGEVRQIAGLGGATIADAMIYMINEDTGQLAGGRMYFSAADGSYTVGDAPDAVYTLVAGHPDYQTARYSGINVIQDTTQDITLDKGAFISGNVLDGTNADLPGVTIVAVAAGATPAYAITDTGGNYAIYGLDAGKQYLLIASKRTYQREFSAGNTPSNSGTTVNFNMIPLPATFDLAGNVANDCSPAVATANARIIASYNPDPGTGKPDFIKGGLTDQNGAYSITNLPQNSNYTVTMVPPGSLAVQRVTGVDGKEGDGGTTGDGITKTQDFTIPCSSEIAGTITLETATNEAYVVLFDYSDDSFVNYLRLTSQSTTTSFNYAFAGIDNTKTYKVLAVADGNIAAWFDGQTSKTNATEVTIGVNSAAVSISLSAQ